MDGILRCLRYAFGPNRLHLCGPEANPELLGYLTEQKPDDGLAFLLEQFKTMYPYLRAIAEANKIKDPFNEKVVEAYWIGNNLLDNVSEKGFYRHLKDELELNKKVRPKQFEKISERLRQGAKMHHSFHVFNIWKNPEVIEDKHTLDNIDKCRVSWGEVISVGGPWIKVKTNSLLFDKEKKLILGPEFEKKVLRRLDNDDLLDVQMGDTIAMHWEIPCEILTKDQLANLKKYTQSSIRLANQYFV